METNTSSSIPKIIDNQADVLTRSIIPNTSTDVFLGSDIVSRRIIVRSVNVRQFTISYNLNREQKRKRNLVANGHIVSIARTDRSIE